MLDTPPSNLPDLKEKSAQAILSSIFGFKHFRHQQDDIISSINQGKNALVLMPTGGGKSLCYQIPALMRNGVGIIISPLIALMQDQVNAIQSLGIRGAFLNSSQDYQTRLAVEKDLRSGQLDLLYIAPERLHQASTLELLSQIQIALFAIDEAHCVSQWGHDFRPEYQQLKILAQRFAHVPRIALTATADKRTRKEIVEQLSLQDAQQYVHSFDRPNIRYTISEGTRSKERLWAFLEANHANDAGIVYCLSRKKTEDIAQWLSDQGRIALPYHAGLPNKTRSEHQARFLKEESIIIVATIAFGMGIDKPDVRFVAHLNLPKSIEAYYQETGRAGRDGAPANAWMAYQLNDVITLRQMLQSSDGLEQYKRITLQKLDAMLALCEAIACRRAIILDYFDDITLKTAKPESKLESNPESNPRSDTQKHSCENCDNCLNPPQTWVGTEAAQKALSCVYRTGQRYGVSYLCDVIAGSETERIMQNKHHQVSTFGIGNDMSKTLWRNIYRQLIARGYLQLDEEGYGALRLSEKSRALLKGEVDILFRQPPKKEAKHASKARSDAAKEGRLVDQPLLDSLKALRLDLAREKNIPPYIIFHDKTLVSMSQIRPKNKTQLSVISGVGEKKLETYGDEFLNVIAANPLPELLQNKLSDTVNQSLALHLDGLNCAEIAKQREIGESAVYTHFADSIEAGLISCADVLELDENEMSQIKTTLDKQNTIETNQLKPAFEALGETIDYGILRCVLAEMVLGD